MKLIIGLGNIGKEYEYTRHNVGFMCLAKFAHRHNLSVKQTSLYEFMRHREALLIMPKTYMNNSGEAYQSAVAKHHDFEDILVISDDIELPVGTIRIRNAGGDGGHNGLKSIFAHAGTNEIGRIRIGIGRSGCQTPRDYVLDEFTSEELVQIKSVIDTVVGWLDLYIRYDKARLLNEYSKWKKKPIPSQEDGINRPKEDKE